MEKNYTIGEIFRLGLLLSHEGIPYKHKATVSKIVNSLKPSVGMTAFGEAKTLSAHQIDEYNSKWNILKT